MFSLIYSKQQCQRALLTGVGQKELRAGAKSSLVTSLDMWSCLSASKESVDCETSFSKLASKPLERIYYYVDRRRKRNFKNMIVLLPCQRRQSSKKGTPSSCIVCKWDERWEPLLFLISVPAQFVCLRKWFSPPATPWLDLGAEVGISWLR